MTNTTFASVTTDRVTDALFDSAIAHLFYAVSMTDRTLIREDKLHLAGFAVKYWEKFASSKASNSNISRILKESIMRNVEAQKAFLVFSEYFYRNRNKFDRSLKSKITETVIAISDKKGKCSKTELILLSKLNTYFEPPEDLSPLRFYQDEA